MTTQVSNYTITHTEIIQALMGIRHEWETAARGDSLIETNGSVGLILADVAVALGLTDGELRLALGDIADELAVNPAR